MTSNLIKLQWICTKFRTCLSVRTTFISWGQTSIPKIFAKKFLYTAAWR